MTDNDMGAWRSEILTQLRETSGPLGVDVMMALEKDPVSVSWRLESRPEMAAVYAVVAVNALSRSSRVVALAILWANRRRVLRDQ